MTSWQYGIMTSPHRMMKKSCVTVVIKFQSSNILDRKDIEIIAQKVTKQWYM